MPNKKLFTWKEEYNLGIKEIDAEHKNVIRIINDLYFILEEDVDEKGTEIVLRDLAEYSEHHFATEEKYFKEFKYKDTEKHIEHHRFFTKKINHFTKRYKKGEEGISFELIDFLEDWFLEHVITLDKEYVDCFHKHGLK